MEQYKTLATPPDSFSGTTMLIRMLDGLAFRYYWATESLDQADMAFAPELNAMPLERQLAHIYRLIAWTHVVIAGLDEQVQETIEPFDEIRGKTFGRIESFKSDLRKLADCDLEAIRIGETPFWNMINGPIVDVFTHIGQINTYRRILGKPSPKVNYFVGTVKE